MGSAEAIIFTIMYAITMLAALVGNSLLIFILWKTPEVRSLTSFMFINMAVADLLVTLVMMPWSVAFFYTEGTWLMKGTFGDFMCRTVTFIAHGNVIAFIVCLIFIAVDRFCAIVYPLRRRAWFRKPKVVTPLLWILSIALMSVIPVTVQSRLHSPNSMCGYNFEIWGEEQVGIRGLFIYLFVISYLILLSIVTPLYAKTIQKLWYHQMRTDLLSQTLQQQRQQRQQNRKKQKSYSRPYRYRRCTCSLLASCADLSSFYRDNCMGGWSIIHCDVSGLWVGAREQRHQPMVVPRI